MKQLKYIFIILTVTFWAACANKASGPQGGPKDETPPKVVNETPLNGTLNYQKKIIVVEFDEIIQLDKVQENVLISPPQIKQPDIKAYNKKLNITFHEDLLDSTTYNIQFGSAIVDNNEKNPLKDYSFSFATGSELDTLEISGVVIEAENLNPIGGVLVGIYSELDDSIFTQKPFLRIGKTDDNGHFAIKNVRAGSYKVFGLSDTSRDYIFQAGEGLALYDSIVTPSFSMKTVMDTLWIDSITIDTILSINRLTYLPNNILLRHFKESKQRQYLIKTERKEPHYFNIYFASQADSLPTIKGIDSDWTSALLLQTNATNDTLTYWITDSLVSMSDTLRFEISYLKTDSLYELQAQTDTLIAIYRKPRIGARVKQEAPKVKYLTFNTNTSNSFEIYNPLTLQMDAPLKTFNLEGVRLVEVVDTLKKPLKFEIYPTDSVNIGFKIPYNWKPESQYELEVDSAALVDIYGHHNDKWASKFKIRSLDEYSKLIIKIEPFNPKAVIQILNNKDEVVRSLPAQAQGAVFEHLKPEEYYMRLFIDENGDGKWTTGDFVKKRHPEEVFYSPLKLTLRANWDFEENWKYLEVETLKQKPKELKTTETKKK